MGARDDDDDARDSDRDRDLTPRYKRSGERDTARRPRPKSYLFGVAPQPPPDAPDPDISDVTSPYELLEREPDHEVQAVVQKAARNAKDPAYFEDVAKLAVALTRERSGNRQRDRDTEEVLREPARVARSSRRHLVAAVVAAAASIAGAVDRCGDRREQGDGKELKQQVDSCKQQVDSLGRELLQLRIDFGRIDFGRHSEIDPDPSASAGALPASINTQGTFP